MASKKLESRGDSVLFGVFLACSMAFATSSKIENSYKDGQFDADNKVLSYLYEDAAKNDKLSGLTSSLTIPTLVLACMNLSVLRRKNLEAKGIKPPSIDPDG